jgi:hypothetical protein
MASPSAAERLWAASWGRDGGSRRGGSHPSRRNQEVEDGWPAKDLKMRARRDCLRLAHRGAQDCLAGLRSQTFTLDVNGVASLA